MFGVGAKSLAGIRLLSFAVVVGQLAGMHFTSALRNEPLNWPWLASLSGTVKGVGQCETAILVAAGSPTVCLLPSGILPVMDMPSLGPLPPFPSLAPGLGHEPQALADVRSTDARSRDTGRCEGVADSFHVILNKVEPAVPNRCFNLLTKDDRRAALLDEVKPEGPQVPLVVEPTTHACHAERLARAGTCPNRRAIQPPRPSEGVTPHADAGEEMALRESGKVVGANIKDAPFIYFTGRDMPGCNQVAQPLGRVGVNLVVIGGHC